ncbi:MAG: hypothetical protein F4091_11030 [Acidimicrobiales bacterium]|nr:hypothetical protein [Acidimicrobiales bacterium]MYD83450.1 hypothetical protein [Acidimicrobiales bacterium]MYJ65981.1 hypothetical protein [Acidimicrobiales bacterium]
MSGQDQHYISKCLIKWWADNNGRVGVICLHHRGSATVPFKRLHMVKSAWSSEQEKRWDKIENRASPVVDALVAALEAHTDDPEAAQRAAEQLLSVGENFTSLVDLAALHHARSLWVPLQQYREGRTTLDRTEAEATIEARWEYAQETYYRCGIDLSVLANPTTLGAVPVFDAQTWGGPKPGAPQQFMMPLAPSVMMFGTPEPDRSEGEIRVVIEENPLETAFMLQLRGEPRFFSSPYLICPPSVLGETARAALDHTTGSGAHWHGQQTRIRRHEMIYANPHRRAGFRQREQQWLDLQARYETAQNVERQQIENELREGAIALQTELDKIKMPICGCGNYRNDREVGTMWRLIMPQIICDAMNGR